MQQNLSFESSTCELRHPENENDCMNFISSSFFLSFKNLERLIFSLSELIDDFFEIYEIKIEIFFFQINNFNFPKRMKGKVNFFLK